MDHFLLKNVTDIMSIFIELFLSSMDIIKSCVLIMTFFVHLLYFSIFEEKEFGGLQVIIFFLYDGVDGKFDNYPVLLFDDPIFKVFK